MRTVRSLVVLLAVVSLVLAACGTEEDLGADAPSTTTSASISTTEAQSATISIGDTDLGKVLVDGDGFTLYIFTNDDDGVSTCEGDCAASWPPFGPATPHDDLAESMFSVISRGDGLEQSTARGAPLYRFSGDLKPGDTNGHGVNDVWFAIGTDGKAVGNESEKESPGSDYGYDY